MSNHHSGGTFAGAGRWCAVASELPCSVVIMVFIGHLLGQTWGGAQGAITGAMIGAIVGLALGLYSVYITIQYYDKLEQERPVMRPFQPPQEEIDEDVEFPDYKKRYE
ncbi:MAG: hypothetical protein GQ580_00775 [Candidatus Thorarchaeota archaeon]|nr:hypothetical protein [Candidatus Thorarchaeota archaeon]